MSGKFFVGLLIAANLAAAAALAAPSRAAVPSTILASAKPDAHGVKRMAVLRGLDKITGRAIEINAPAGVPVRFGTLSIIAQYCYTVPPEEPPETTAFLQIDEIKPGEDTKQLFSGWMFASTPALNGLEHPVYDVWVITCKTDEPARTSSAAPGSPGRAAGSKPAKAAAAPLAGTAAAEASGGASASSKQ
jgi:hypothetical protein